MSQESKPKVILISGTSSGFGALFAVRLAKLGHIVYASMRDLNKKSALEQLASKRGVSLHICAMDVTVPETIDLLVTTIIQKHGRLDVVINNAGVALGGFFEDLDIEQMRTVMEINFWGAVNVNQRAVPQMRAQKNGMIINISSIAGQTASPALSAYHASKWALEGYSEGLYYELKRYGVHIVLVEPGSYPTKIFKENTLTGKRSLDPRSPYYHYSQRLNAFVDDFRKKTRRDPEDVAVLVEKIIGSKNPRLRYVSDLSSLLRVFSSKIIPPSVYRYIYEKVIYGQSSNAL